jgi:CRP-like cAMP-binding protein
MASAESLGRNRLLASLATEDRERLSPALDQASLELKKTLYGAGEPIEAVYFPIDAVISILTTLDEGARVEIATIGNEGLVGLTIALGGDAMNPRESSVVQVPGEALVMDAELFREELERRGALASVIERYTQAFLSQVSQQVACNGLHSIEQRCARWILLTHDRVGTNEFPMTQEFLSQMLGVRRASVTVVAGILQRAGFIQFRRGKLTVLDREGLEGTACECYAVTREVFDRLLP